VNGENLARISKEMGVEEFLLMSRGEAKDTGRARQYLLANAMEAIIGSIYLDQGYGKAEEFILKKIASSLDEVLESKSYMDAKSYFQEKAQDVAKVTPMYKVLAFCSGSLFG
jgi:ribonuclease-3